MGFQTLEILRQGVWASLTGGWFYDPHQNLFCNTFHFYTWMFLVLIPYSIHVCSTSWYGWLVYVGVILLTFLVLKITNYRLHAMFDTTDAIEEPLKSADVKNDTNPVSDGEDIELQVLESKESRTATPPVDCSSRNSVLQQPLLETFDEIPQNSRAVGELHRDVKVDVHRKNSSTSSDAITAAEIHTITAMMESNDKDSSPSKPENEVSAELSSVKMEPSVKKGKPPRSSLNTSGGRRFSNVSNLAMGMSSTTTSAPGLQGCSSLEFGFVLEDSALTTSNVNNSRQGSHLVRRTLSALDTCPRTAGPSTSAVSAPLNVGDSSGSVVFKTIEEQSCEQKKDEDSTQWTPFIGSAPPGTDAACTQSVISASKRDLLTLPQLEEQVEDSGAYGGPSCCKDLDSPSSSSGSSSSSSSESTESEAVRLLPPATPRVAVSWLGMGINTPGSGNQNVISKRRQDSVSTCTEETVENDSSTPAAKATDDLHQLTPPKRRKLAARRRRHPAGETLSNPGAREEEPAAKEMETLLPSTTSSERSRRGSRQRRRRRHTPSESAPPPDDHHWMAPLVYGVEFRRTEASPFAPAPPHFPWFITPPPPPPPVTTLANPAANPAALSNSSVSLTSGNTVLLESPTVFFQPRDRRPGGFRNRGILERRVPMSGASSGGASSGGAIIDPGNVSDYLGSTALHNFLHNFHSARGTLQLINSGGNPFSSSVVDSMAEVLGGRSANIGSGISVSQSEARTRLEETNPKPKKYYKFFLTKKKWVKIRFDRLKLLALLDRNSSIVESFLSVSLAVIISLLAAMLLRSSAFRDFEVFLFCMVCAGCQYSLLKSVQPDAASPTHGFNRLVPFARPFYFCLCNSALLVIHLISQSPSCCASLQLYGVQWGSSDHLAVAETVLRVVILCFPVIFSLGLLPQVSTFAIYFLEQVDMHLFGGTAVTGLNSAVYAVSRSVLFVGIASLAAYCGLRHHPQHIIFSAFCGFLVAGCYHISRSSSDPSVLWNCVLELFRTSEDQHQEPKEKSEGEAQNESAEYRDELPQQMQETVKCRLRSDLILCCLIAVLVFAVHCSTVFTALQPILSEILWTSCAAVGLLLHYVIPQARKQLPWLCFSRPFLRSHEHEQFRVLEAAKLMWFEKIYLWLTLLEKQVLYPALFLNAITRDASTIVSKFGLIGGTLIVVVCSSKALRSSLTNPAPQYLIITFCILLFSSDLRGLSETFLIDYLIVSIVYHKLEEFLQKLQFVITYIAPWQITWGSAFHAFAQPFSVPHSAMLFAQAAFSSLVSAPLSPFLGSAIFLTSYARPVKFWERDYNTRRIDHSNTRLVAQIERNPGGDDNNLNSIFYEHLTRSLQKSLGGDILLGRWGPVFQGDCFVLASDNLNCLVHVVELGNGLVTFQVRGLEFRGTYCQQREVEAISEGVEDDKSCCCCEPGHLPHMLGGNAAFNQRWLAWQVIATKYVLEGYSISDNNAASMLHVFDLRRLLVTYYVKSIIYYTLRSPKLEDWLSNRNITEALAPLAERGYADVDPVFNVNIDEDYDYHLPGVTRGSFCSIYLGWIQYCGSRREKVVDCSRDSLLVSLCMALSLLGRRALGSAAHSAVSSVEFFLYGLHALFKGDFRITSLRDEWVFNDMELLRRVVAPAVRMSLKLHQDHFTFPDDYDEPSVLYEAIGTHEEKLVISHEGDPAWRHAVLSGVPSLLALRHVVDDTSDDYKIIMLNKRFLSFRVIKLNRECVRGLWAGQQQELVYLRNRNQERGSIQNAKQVLRNIINSSCDQPIGYPIYVSPLMTSFADTHPQISKVLGGPVSFQAIQRFVVKFFRRMRTRCGEGCSSGGSAAQCDVEISLENIRPSSMSLTAIPTRTYVPSSAPCTAAGLGSHPPFNATLSSFTLGGARGSSPRSSLGTQRGSIASTVSNTNRKPSGSTLISLAGMLAERDAPAAPPGPPVTSGAPGATSVRERRPSRASEDREMRRRDRAAAEKSSRRTGSSSRPDDDRRGARERNRRRERERMDPFERRDMLERLDLPETMKDLLTDEEEEPELQVGQIVLIVDHNQVYDTLNLGRRIDVLWPNNIMRVQGGKSYWKHWLPANGMTGTIVHRWVPNHADPRQRSHVDRAIALLQIEDKYVPIAESAVKFIHSGPTTANNEEKL